MIEMLQIEQQSERATTILYISRLQRVVMQHNGAAGHGSNTTSGVQGADTPYKWPTLVVFACGGFQALGGAALFLYAIISYLVRDESTLGMFVTQMISAIAVSSGSFKRAGLQVKRSKVRSCTWGIIHPKSKFLIIPGCSRRSVAL